MLQQRQKAEEIIEDLTKAGERRYEIRLAFIGHFGAGKTTLINRLRQIPFEMKETKSTNCIVVITKEGVNMEDGKWRNIEESDEKDLLKRMKRAKEDKTGYIEKKSRKKELESSNRYKASEDAIKIEEIKTDGQVVCRICIWDFAGQSIFNTLHQMFMSYRAIYVIVFNISIPFEVEIEDDNFFCLGFERRMNIQDFCIFLLQTVHMYHGQEKDMFPKVLLVGTHKDKVDEDIAKHRMEVLKKEILKYPALQNHVVGDFIVNNSNPDDQAFQNMKQKIFRMAKGEPTWGETTPASWMPLERDIIKLRNSGTNIQTLKEIKDINEKCYISLESDDAIYAFLKFQNSLGNMMFFGKNDPDDLIILQPQWLIDSVKQIITHEQFYTRPVGFCKSWEEFTQCAKLHIDLMEAIWSQNADKTFVNHKRKVRELLESTDIFCSPKVYKKDGDYDEANYVFVPSMLKPNQAGVYLLKKTLQKCKSKSPTFCFVFKEKFIPPAIFQRVQAACTKEYTIQQVDGNYSLFYQCAIFQLDRNHELILEQYKHIIRVNVVSFTKSNVSSDVCEVFLTFLDDTLENIISLYQTRANETAVCQTTADQDKKKHEPLYCKAIQCPRAENKDEALFFLDDDSAVGKVNCKDHKPDECHELDVSELIAVWQKNRSVIKEQLSPLPVSRTGDATLSKLNARYLGRLARFISNTDLILAASNVYEPHYIDNLRIEHQGNAIDFNFSLLWKWATNKTDEITLNDIQSALEEVDGCYREKDFQQGIIDKDYAEHFQDIPASFLDRSLDDAIIDQISQRTGKEYRQLAIELGVSPPVIEREVIENLKVVDRIRGLIRQWKSCNKEPTFRQVAKAIIEVNMDINIINDCFIESEKRAKKNLQELEQEQKIDWYIESKVHEGNLWEPEQENTIDYNIKSKKHEENLQEPEQGKQIDCFIKSEERAENVQGLKQRKIIDCYIESEKHAENLQEPEPGKITLLNKREERAENVQDLEQVNKVHCYIESEERAENVQKPEQEKLIDCYIESEEHAENLQEPEQGKLIDCFIEKEKRAENLQEPQQGKKTKRKTNTCCCLLS